MLGSAAAYAGPYAYLVTRIKAPQGGSRPVVFDLNNAGEMSGDAYFGNQTLPYYRGVHWSDPDSSTLLSGPAGQTWVEGIAINNLGDVCGYSANDRAYRAFVWAQATTRKRLPDVAGTEGSQCVDLNEAGAEVGVSHIDGWPYQHALRWDAAGVHDLGDLGGNQQLNSTAAAINNSGLIIGTSETGVATPVLDNPRHAVMWQNDVIADLGTFGGATSSASGLNDAGQIVGAADLDLMVNGAQVKHAALWQNGVIEDLDLASGINSTENSQALAINSAGVIVGSSGADGHATLWDHGTRVDLHELLASQIPAGYRLASGTVINDNGQILLFGFNTVGNVVNYLATPVSPTHVTLTSSAAVVLAGVPILFRARVSADSGAVPGGTLTFKDGSTVLGTATLDINGTATFRATLSVGQHPVTASFPGHVPFGPSVSPVLLETVIILLPRSAQR